jgi:uncharacterized protein HemX
MDASSEDAAKNLAEAAAAPTKREPDRRPRRMANSQEDDASRLVISNIVSRLHAQARALRLLGYGFLLLIALLLAGGAYFYWFAQTFVLDQIKERSEQVRSIRDDMEKKRLDIQNLEAEIADIQKKMGESKVIFSTRECRVLGYFLAARDVRS